MGHLPRISPCSARVRPEASRRNAKGLHASVMSASQSELQTQMSHTCTSFTSCSSFAGGPLAATPSPSAARRYFFTVSRATPLARAIARYDSPSCQRRTTSTISMRLIGRRNVCLATAAPRPITTIAAVRELTRAEGALLTAAMLRGMGIDAKLVWATIDDEASALCVWRDNAGPWHPAPIWPAHHVRVHGERVVDAEPGTVDLPPLVGWQVIAAYTQVTPRTLPALRALISGGVMADAVVERPTCPACKSEMRLRRGPTGRFWGCSQYPTCRQTMPMADRFDDPHISASRLSAPSNGIAGARPVQPSNGPSSQQSGLADLPF